MVRRLGVVALVLVSAALVAGCGKTIRVRDTAGHPLPDARVFATYDEGMQHREFYTGPYGDVQISTGAYKALTAVQISKPGYVKRTLFPPFEYYGVDVVLQEDPKAKRED